MINCKVNICCVLLCLLFKAFTIHNYIPLTLLDTVLVPIVKDKKGDSTDKDNYWPLAIATVMSKLLECLILAKYNNELIIK